MSYQFKDSENERYRTLIETEFLKNPNPFPRNPVCSRDNLPKFCLGRNEEIGIIKNAIEKVSSSYNQKSAWIPISGSGGTGKTTIALYVYDSAKNKKSRDLKIDYLECAYMECPSDSNFLNIVVIYQKILEDLGNPPGSFPYFLGFKFVLNLCSFFEQNASIKDEFLKRFSSIWKLVSKSPDHTDLLKQLKNNAPNFAMDLKNFVKDYDYVILTNQETKSLQISYIQLLIDLISTNTDDRLKAFNEIMGKDLQNEDYAIKMLEYLISVINFLFHQSCLLIIIDNFENLPLNNDSCQNIFRFLLKFRGPINNCLLLTIGSTDFWEFFKKNLNPSQLNMLDAFKYDDISLINISEKDASLIMNRYLAEFWNSIDQQYRPKGADIKFPFSLEAFQYLYEIKDRNLRDSLKELNRIVEKYKIETQITYLKNIKDSIYYLRPKMENIYLFENEMNYLEDFLSNFTNRNQLSINIEMGLFTAFNELKSKSQFGKDIYKVEHGPKIKTDTGEIAKPDVYLTLFGSESVQDIKKAEIQVKAYFPTSKVKIDEIEGSLMLLKEKKTHLLSFLTISPLEDKILEALQTFGPQVGRISKLNNEESYYLLLLTKEFSKLFFKDEILECNFYLQVFNKIGLNLPEFFEKIKRIQLEEKRIPEEKKPIKVPIQIPLPLTLPPKTPEEKVSNAAKLEPYIINFLKEKKLIKKKEDLIEALNPLAVSKNVIINAITNLQEKKMLQYSRSKPQGWSLVT